MTLLGRVVRGAGLERRDLTSTLANPSSWLRDALASSSTYTSRSVTPENGLQLVPVYSAVQLISSAVGQLPLVVYKRLDDGGKDRAPQHRAWSMLHDAPNPEMAADEFWSMVTMHLLTCGNHFSAKSRNALGLVDTLWPLHPSRVMVERDKNGDKRYIVDGSATATDFDILHIKGPSWDGLVGWSPIQMARQSLAGMMEQEEYSTRFWNQGAIPPVVLTHPGRLSDVAVSSVKDSWRILHAGAGQSGDPAVLQEGMKAETIALPHEDAQFIETQRWNDVRVAQLFGIPPYMIGAQTGDSLTYTSTEMQGRNFVQYSLQRWIARIEQSLTRDPSIFVQGTRFFAEFLVDAFLRASTKERYEAYQIGLNAKFLDVDEVRNLENLPPREEDPEPDPFVEPPPPPAAEPDPVTGA